MKLHQRGLVSCPVTRTVVGQRNPVIYFPSANILKDCSSTDGVPSYNICTRRIIACTYLQQMAHVRKYLQLLCACEGYVYFDGGVDASNVFVAP